MSSSAFTPSTTTVTNNVPVNVPIVTAWEAYTPTFNGFGTVTGLDAKWMRVGTSLRAQIKFTSGTLQASTTARISIPSGLTIDSSIANKIIGTSTTQFSVTSGQNNSCLLFVESGQTTNVSFCNIGDGSSTKNLSALNSQTIFGSNAPQSVQFEVPISEWAGSGTTTLATRAVEEYAWTSGTWDADSSTVAYGPSGSIISGALTANRTKTVTFQTNILATDKIEVEISDNGVNWQPWIGFTDSAGNGPISIVTTSGGARAGILLQRINTTQVNVIFYRYYGAFTDGTGLGNWQTNWRWRLRKVSGGAAVGYPVSARNIVGDTSGTAVPAGMLAETIQVTGTSLIVGSTTAGTFTTLVTLSNIPAGKWRFDFSAENIEISGQASDTAGAATGRIPVVSIFKNGSETQRFFCPGMPKSTVNSGYLLTSARGYLIDTKSTTDTYDLRFSTFNNSGTPTISSLNCNGSAITPIVFTATRIA